MLPEEPLHTENITRLPVPKRGAARRIICGILTVLLALASVAATGAGLSRLAMSAGMRTSLRQTGTADVPILDKYDMSMTNAIAGALDGVLAIEKVYWLSDKDLIAPKPDQAKYGEADNPEELKWLLDEAADLLEGQKLLFSLDTPVWERDKIRYYVDDTILAITWKQVIDYSVFTISEVKIAHPSQFRRFLAGGEFGSDKQYVTTEMARSVNAVVATSGDFYKFRRSGAIVYNGALQRFEGETVDTCLIDEAGDLHFVYRGELKDEEQARKYIEDNHVRFSLAFGPVLIDDGVACAPSVYALGEINDDYSRAAVCQMDKLHYLFVNVCAEWSYSKRQTIREFAANLEKFGCQKAYALDGGQTTVIAMDGELISAPDFGWQRQISDIIYFATALPDGG